MIVKMIEDADSLGLSSCADAKLVEENKPAGYSGGSLIRRK
jgi:hypothetical protein